MIGEKITLPWNEPAPAFVTKSSETQLPSQNAIGDKKFATSASANGSNDCAFRSAPVRASPDRWEVGFWIKLNQEERLLLRGSPDEYPGYMARVKAVIPYAFLTRGEGTIGYFMLAPKALLSADCLGFGCRK